MKFEQPASQGRPVLANPPNSEDGTRAGEDAPVAIPPRGEPAQPDAFSALTQEVQRLVRKLADEPPKPSRLKSLSSHPLFIVVVTFVLTVIVGGHLTNKYTLGQQELARQRSFTDELNKIRVQKIGEVWEHVDRTEVELDALVDRANEAPEPGDKDLSAIAKLVEEDVAIVNKNRFWLGEQNYGRLKNYLEINRSYVLDKLLGRPGIDLTDTVRKREQAKQDVLQIRNMFLKGELEP